MLCAECNYDLSEELKIQEVYKEIFMLSWFSLNINCAK